MKSDLPPVHVINLPRASERRERMRASLSAAGIPFAFVEAVDGSSLTADELKRFYSLSKTFQRIGRGLHPNEIGCSLSHSRIWEWMVNESVPEVLVLEDDISPLPVLREVLRSRFEWLPPDWRLVNFAYDMATPLPIKTLPSGHLAHLSVCTFDKVVMRAGAYLINLDGAKSLLRHAHPVTLPLDDLTGNASLLGVPVYGISPRIACWDESIESTIWTDQTMDNFIKESRGNMVGFILRMMARFRKFLR